MSFSSRLMSSRFQGRQLSLTAPKRCTRQVSGQRWNSSFSRSAISATRSVSLGAVVIGAVGVGTALFFINRKSSTQANADEAKTMLDPANFKEFQLSEVRKLNHNTSIFKFKFDDPSATLGLPVASCIVTKAPIGEDGKPVVRPYTPTTLPDEKGFFELMIKNYPQGVMSKHIHSLKVGDKLEVKGPFLKIKYTPNMKKKIGMIAGGSGITPMLQVAREIMRNPGDKTEVTLVFANIGPEDILLKNEFDKMAKEHKNFKVYYVLEKPPQGWTQGVGFVNEDIVKAQMPPPSPENLVMVCGPPPMMKAISGDKAPDKSQGEVEGILKKLGYTKDSVFKF